MFGKKPQNQSESLVNESDGKKGRPTPTRREAEAANKRPLAPQASWRSPNGKTPTSREERIKARERMNQALRTGDERYLPARDKGPVKRWTRDWIDSRRSGSEYFVVIAMVLIVLAFAFQNNKYAGAIVVLVMYGFTLAFLGEVVVRAVRLRAALRRRFKAVEVPRGTVMYGVARSLQLRRSRLPKPQVQRGERPSETA
ncbi:MAG: DUF3043 domain-containing protein [Bifidobacteriaceae bacterium]|nr:DUF3043 domain-containing protein [Bifidobacteriaceae bacterium]